MEFSTPETSEKAKGAELDGEESLVIQKINKEVEAIKDRFKTEEQLLTEKLEREKELLDQKVVDDEEREALKLELAQEYVDNLEAIEQEARDKKLEAEKKLNDEIAKAESIAQRDKIKQTRVDDKIARDSARRDENIARNAMALASLVFEDNKAVSAGIAFVNTAQGVTKALSEKDFVSAALIAATGAVQISNILGASKGGGSVSSVPSKPIVEPDFIQDTTDLDFTDSNSSGSATNLITFNTDTGDQLVDAIADALNKGQAEGRF